MSKATGEWPFLFLYIQAMNFLAHIHLSGDNKEIKIGNFIADSVRKKDLENFSPQIQLGIHLHWAIDEFTDHHPTVNLSKELIYEDYHKYSAVLVDIYYDHYLAKNWSNYSNEDLRFFVNDFYHLMKEANPELPQNIQRMLPYMVRYDWLFNYQFISGIDQVLGGMSRRASFKNSMHKGARSLEKHYEEFKKHLEEFYPELTEHVATTKTECEQELGL
jgi:acyl carrier protein phosphodiesterase